VGAEIEPRENPETELERLRALSEQAEGGDEGARAELRRAVAESSPGVIAEASGIARRVEWMLVRTVSAGEPLMQEALAERMRRMRTEIAGERPTPLEALLAERVVAGWLLVEVLEGLVAAQYRRDAKSARVGPAYLIQHLTSPYRLLSRRAARIMRYSRPRGASRWIGPDDDMILLARLIVGPNNGTGRSAMRRPNRLFLVTFFATNFSPP
jgi:hypothetical protein